MNRTAVIALERFRAPAKQIAEQLNGDLIPYDRHAFETAFGSYSRIVALMSAGIAVRSIAPLLKDKWTDPCIVVVSPDMKYAIPLTGGHHGGNDLAAELESLGMIPVISTATEVMGLPSVEKIAKETGCGVVNRDSTRAVNAGILDTGIPVYTITGPSIAIAEENVSLLIKKGEYTVGIGCKKGIHKDEIISAIRDALKATGISGEQIFAFATTGQKLHEQGMIEAVNELGGNLVFVDDETINSQDTKSPSRASLIGLSGVAEPASLAISKRKEIIMRKKVYGRVTVAISR